MSGKRMIEDGRLIGRVEYDELGPQVFIDEARAHIPRRWTLRITVGDSSARVDYEVFDGVPTPRALHLEPVTAAALKTVTKRLGVWTELCERELVTTEQVTVTKPTAGALAGFTLVGHGGPVLSPDEADSRRRAGAKALRSRREITEQHLLDVRAVYLSAPWGQKHAAVMEHFDCGRGRANLLIRRAREAGLIETVGQGKAATL